MVKKEISPSSSAASDSGEPPSDSGDTSQLRVKETKNIRRKRSQVRQVKPSSQNNVAATEISSLSFSSSSESSSSSENDVMLTGKEGSDDGGTRETRLTCGKYGSVSIIGRRREMEDTVTVKLGFLTNYDFFGVYDGHGGTCVAQACRERLHCLVAEEVEKMTAEVEEEEEERERVVVDWEKLMVESFGKMDEEVNGGDDVVVGGGGGGGGGCDKEEVVMIGSTAVVAVVGKEEVVVANCGDSRAVISRNGVAVALSNDHKPDRADELERIEAAGGRVINWNGYRVLGVLATSRSIGDQYLKPFVTSEPEVTVITRTDTDEFLILASDGLWDVVSNEIACQLVRRCLHGRLRRRSQEGRRSSSRATEAALMLAELAISRGSKDNISVIVVELKKCGRFFC